MNTYHWWTLVYVIDCSQEHGREFKRRVPRFVARAIRKRSSMCLDWCKEI